MDSDFWASRLAAAKRQFHHQHHQLHAASHLDRLNWDDFDVGDEVRPDIPCPYCYEDLDLGSLCTHLEDEHSSESRPTVCPICAVKVSRDVSCHITLQHGHLFKMQRRRRLRRAGEIPNFLGREAHLHNILGGGGFRSNSNSTSMSIASINDPLLSSPVLNLPADDISASDISINNTWMSIRAQPSKPSYDPCLSSEERKRMVRQASGRAGFVQDLLFCTFLED